MNFLSVGNLGSHIQNLKLQTQWTLKQQSGRYDAKGKSLEEWLEGSLAQTEESPYGAKGDQTLRKIQQKLESGGTLTSQERDYLQAHDPEAYQELVNQEREQKAYEQALRRCKSREEVERLRITRLNTSLSTIRTVENNPHIPLNKKLEITLAEKQRVDRMAESTRKFVASGEYAKLPTQEEENKANQEAQEAHRPDASENPRQEPAVAPEGIKNEAARPQTSEETPPDVLLESPEEKKVRRARAKAAYAAAAHSFSPSADSSIQVKA